MNDLGWSLGWLAVQVGFLLIPALGLQVLASRKSPASGAWVAGLSLGMVIFLGVLAFVPVPSGLAVVTDTPTSRSSIDRRDEPKVERVEVARTPDETRPKPDRGRTFAEFRLAWSRFERRAAAPIARFRPWGQVFALAMLAGSAVGLARLLIGLWAVALCRWRGRLVVEPDLLGLVEELRHAMGCHREVELREVADLATPATAGWFRPLLLLPGNWRSWDESERRAVVAHELAHVVRRDYASGLLARVAVVLNFYHPLVRCMAGRLHLEQELAADAMGARFAGGRSSYLLALSRLALEQEGRPSSWPARAFLPARGTLIRRIAMLKNKQELTGQSGSKPMRLATALTLLAITIGVASWKSPSRIEAQEFKLGTIDVSNATARELPPFLVNYVPEGRLGVVAFHPAAILRQPGMNALTTLLRDRLFDDKGIEHSTGKLKVDQSTRQFVKFGWEDIESVVCTFDISDQQRKGRDPKLGDRKLYSLEMFESGGVTVRRVAPFDWLAFLRQCQFEFDKVQEPRGEYYRIKIPQIFAPDFHVCIYLPDDRTIVYEKEAVIKRLIARETPTAPAYLRGPEWERVSRDLVACTIDNQNDVLVKRFTLGRPEDAPILEFLKGVDRMTIGLTDNDSLTPHGEVTCREPAAAERTLGTIQNFLNLTRAAIAVAPGVPEEQAPFAPIFKGFIAAVKVAREGQSVTASAQGFGTFVEVGKVFKEMVEEGDVDEPKAEEARAKTEKR